MLRPLEKYLKSLLRIVFYSLLIYSVLVILEYARQGFINDLSLQKVDLSLQEKIKEPIYLVSYADGKESVYRNQNAMHHYALNKGIDFILNYKCKHLDSKFIERNSEIFKEVSGAGRWVWKPYIILETMKKAPEGAIIIYLDSAFIIKKPVLELITYLGNNDILLAHDRNRKNGAYTKGESFALMDCLGKECRNGPHIWSAMVVVRNSELSRTFIEKWLEGCQDKRILFPKNYGIHPNYEEFVWHHSDQSILSLVYQKNQKSVGIIEFDDILPILSWFHRNDSKSSPLKTWYSLYGVDPVINFNTKGKSLSSTSLLNAGPLVRLRKWFIETF